MAKSDSLAALGALNRLSGGTTVMNRVIRECALDLAEGSYVVDVYGHLPADLNELCDSLSRMNAPKENRKDFPNTLKNVHQAQLQDRKQSWWRTIGPPRG